MPKRFEAAILRLQVRDAVLSHDSLADMLQKVEAMEKEENTREKAEHEENERVRQATQEPARDEDIKRKIETAVNKFEASVKAKRAEKPRRQKRKLPHGVTRGGRTQISYQNASS
jgi:DNA-binding protein H-NS